MTVPDTTFDFDPKKLRPGDLVRHISGTPVAVLRQRKEDDSGWWLLDGSGLADFAWRDNSWTVVGGNDLLQRAYNALCSAEASLREAGATDFEDRIATIRAELATDAFRQGGNEGVSG